MKIRLLRTLPVRKGHGMTEGRVLEVVGFREGGGFPEWYVMGNAGLRVGVLENEAEEVKGETDE